MGRGWAAVPEGLLGHCYALKAHCHSAPSVVQAEVPGVWDVDEPAGRTNPTPAGVMPEVSPGRFLPLGPCRSIARVRTTSLRLNDR